MDGFEYNNAVLKIGLTGGIGCGKTSVADLFKKRGVEIIDADEIAHQVVEPGGAGLQSVVQHFGTHILDCHGRLDRAALREIVFDSPKKRRALEAILHPLVYRHIESKIEGVKSPYCIVCVPLLLETGRIGLFDRILVVDCPIELQYQRVRQRDHLDDAQITRILESQASREEKLSVADDLIFNDADLASLDNQVEKLHNFYLQLSTRTG